tara:strand:+ start:154 stop:468 length:315 start_codon:yes stop_codon:yes gene_type:complete
MAKYFMGGDIDSHDTIIGKTTIPSEYQYLIDQYRARGGTVGHCWYGQRTTDTKIPAYSTSKAEVGATVDRGMQGKTLMDEIEQSRHNQMNPDAMFDVKENNNDV